MHKTRRVESQDLRAGFEHDGRIARAEGFDRVADRADANAKWLEETLKEAYDIIDATRKWSTRYARSIVVDITVRIEESEDQ